MFKSDKFTRIYQEIIFLHLFGKIQSIDHFGNRTVHQDRQIALLAKRNRMSSAVTLNRDLRAASGVRISTQTVRNRLHASGLHARKPAVPVRPPLTACHRNCRLQFARRHAN
jgi:hypothetical protein